MKKILFLINTLKCGGAEKVLVETVNSIASEANDITVQTIFGNGVFKEELLPSVNYKTVIKNSSNFFVKLFYRICIKYMPKRIFYNFFIKDDYDYEIAFLEGWPTQYIAASTNTKAKKIAWVHTDLMKYSDSSNVYKGELEEKKAYSKYDAIACVSDGVKDSFIRKYGKIIDNITTVYNIIDEDKILKLSQDECPIKKTHPLIISVGRLTEQKNFIELLKVLKKLNDENIMCELWIIGEGEKRVELEKYIQDNDLHNAKLLGFKNNPYKYMKEADVFVSSSKAEGFSTVITEAVILGIPVISTNTSGANEPCELSRCSVVVDNYDEMFFELKDILVNKEKLAKVIDENKEKKRFFNKNNLLKQLNDFLLTE